MIDAAIVGLGRWGKTLVEAMQGKSALLRFTHAVSRDPAQHGEFNRAHGLVGVADLATVLALPEIAAIVLATPHSSHSREILAAAAAGKAVFCEKPLALTRRDAEQAIAACRDAGVALAVGTDKRFFSAMRELTRLVAEGELGRLLHVEAHFSNENAATQLPPWRRLTSESPAGGLTATGIHILDALIGLAGPVRQVQAVLHTHKPPPDPLDSLAVLLAFAGGATGTMATVRSSPLYWRVHAFGSNGSAEVLGRTELVLRRRGADPQHRRFPPVDSVRTALDAFADAVAGRAPFPIPDDEMLACVAAFEAIVRAVGDGPPIQAV